MPSSDAWWKAHIVQPQIQSVSRTVWQQDPMDACTKGHTSKFRTGRTIQAETQKEMISKWRNASSKGGCKCGCRRTVHCILLKEHVWKQANIYMYILCIYVYIYICIYRYFRNVDLYTPFPSSLGKCALAVLCLPRTGMA